MTDPEFCPEPHQKLIDGLNVLMLQGWIEKDEAVKTIAWYSREFPLSGSMDAAVLLQIQKDHGAISDREASYQLQSTQELEIRLGEVQVELADQSTSRLPFWSFGDYEIEAKLNIEADYLEAELRRRS